MCDLLGRFCLAAFCTPRETPQPLRGDQTPPASVNASRLFPADPGDSIDNSLIEQLQEALPKSKPRSSLNGRLAQRP